MKPTKAWVIVSPQSEMLIGTLCKWKKDCIRYWVRWPHIRSWKYYAAQGYRCEPVVITKVKARGK